jgi:hypothetical protein|tara:strand:+ start:27397 stop:27678 length:282 start_codon:yes stop_codon:yes gene_type:complete
MVEVFLIVTSMLNIVASIFMYQRWLNTPVTSSQKGHSARAHYLCSQALLIEQMPNSYAKIVAYDEWRQQLADYDLACQQEQAIPGTKHGFRIV